MQDDILSDADLEREIERALAVDPSPELLARVRNGIASEPAPWTMSTMPTISAMSMVSARRKVALIASAAAVAIVAGVSARIAWHHTVPLSSEAPVLASAVPRLSSAIAPGPLNAPTVPSAGASRSEAPLVVRQQTGSRSRSATRWTRTRAEPEVLVDRRESETIRRLIAHHRDDSISRDQANLSYRAEPIQSLADTLSIGDIEPSRFPSIPPIDIQPLETVAREEGARQ